VTSVGDASPSAVTGRPAATRCLELRDVCTTYDALYVALAEALDASLVTRDARLARAVAGLVDAVVP
jgi:predicted nucleic acid-binding protein